MTPLIIYPVYGSDIIPGALLFYRREACHYASHLSRRHCLRAACHDPGCACPRHAACCEESRNLAGKYCHRGALRSCALKTTLYVFQIFL